MNKFLLSSLAIVTVIGGLALIALGTQQNPITTAAIMTLAVEDSEIVRIERLFSHGPTWSRPAPLTWSSRLKVRSNARWDMSPRYAV